MNKMTNIGQIKGTHHLNGAVKINTGFRYLESLINEKILLENSKGMNILTIKSVKSMTDKKYIIKFVEINNINEAKELIGSSIKIRDDLIPEIKKEEYYTNDLISFKVYNTDSYIGDVVDILETAAHDILVVQKEEKEVLIPFVENVFIKEIEFKDKNIIVELLKGML